MIIKSETKILRKAYHRLKIIRSEFGWKIYEIAKHRALINSVET